MKVIRLVIVVVALVVPSFGSSAGADVNRYTINANSPKPAVCNNDGTIPPGTWMQNKVCGYWIGMAMAGSSFDVHLTQSSNYHYGRVWGSNNICAWIPPGALSDDPTGTAPESCSAATMEAMSHRRAIGDDFDYPPHDPSAGVGWPITVDPSCTAYYSYFTTSTLLDGAARNPAGHPAAEIRYRYTANGSDPTLGRMAAVRDATLGWIFFPRSCVLDWHDIDFNHEND